MVEAKELLPIVPVFNYTNKPIVPWKKEANRIKSISELKGQDECFEYVNNNDEVKKGKITGSALLTGKISNIMVLDLDRNHGDGTKDGIKAYKELIDSLQLTEEEKKQVFDTFTIKTPNGGLHLYFKYIEGLNIIRPAVIFAGIYYGILPIVSTYLSERVDKFVQKQQNK